MCVSWPAGTHTERTRRPIAQAAAQGQMLAGLVGQCAQTRDHYGERSFADGLVGFLPRRFSDDLHTLARCLAGT